MTIGERLKQARESAGMYQYQVADVLRVQKDTYRSYESGRLQIQVRHVPKICKTLNISADWLLGVTS